MAYGDFLLHQVVTSSDYIYRIINEVYSNNYISVNVTDMGGIAIHPVTGDLYLAANISNIKGIYRYENGSLNLIHSISDSFPKGIAIATNGDIYIAYQGGNIYKYNGITSSLYTTLSGVGGLTWDNINNHLIAVDRTSFYTWQGSSWSSGIGSIISDPYTLHAVAWNPIDNNVYAMGSFQEDAPLEMFRYDGSSWSRVTEVVFPNNGLNIRGMCYDTSNLDTFEPSIDRLEYTDGSDYNSFSIYFDNTEGLPAPFGNQSSSLRVLTFRNNDSGDDSINIGVNNDFSPLFELEGIIDVVLEDTYIRFELTGSDLTDVYSLVSSVGNFIVSEGNPAPARSEAYTRLSLYVDYPNIDISAETPLPTISTQVEAYTTTPPLVLSDFNSSGITLDFLALIEVSGDPALYTDTNRGGSDVPIEGELGLGTGETLISRIFWNTGTNQLVFNDNDNPVSIDLGPYYAVGGAARNQTIHFQISNSLATFLVEDGYADGGDSWVRFENLPENVNELLNGLSIGDRLIVGASQPSVTYISISLDTETPLPTGQPSVESYNVDYVDIALSTETPLPTASITVSSVEPLPGYLYSLGAWNTEGWSGSILIDPVLVVGGAEAHLRYIRRIGTGWQFRVSSTSSEDPANAGPELIPLWETYDEAITLTAEDGTVLVLKGPGNPDNSFADPSEPYFWIPDNSAEASTWYDNAIGQDVSILLSYVPPAVVYPNIDLSAQTPLPTLNTIATTYDVVYPNIDLSIETPLPTLNPAVSNVVYPVISISAQTPLPTFNPIASFVSVVVIDLTVSSQTPLPTFTPNVEQVTYRNISLDTETPLPIYSTIVGTYEPIHLNIDIEVETPLPTFTPVISTYDREYPDISISIETPLPTFLPIIARQGGRYVWAASRQISGAPTVGDDVVGVWDAPIRIDIPDDQLIIPPDSITALEIAPLAITASEIADLAITADKIENLAITADKIEDFAIDGTKIANGAVVTGKIDDDAITATKIADGSIITGKIAAGVVTATEIANGSIITSKIGPDAITVTQIADGSITTGKIVGSAVTATKIANGSITTSKIDDNAITVTKIADGNITTGKIVNNAVTATKIGSGAVTTSKIDDDAITVTKIADGSIITGKIAGSAVTATKIGSGAVTTSKIGSDSVTATKIANGAVTTGKIANGAVTATEIADGSVITTKVSPNSITSTKIADGSITTTKIGEGAATSTKIADGSITTTKIANGTITSVKIGDGSIIVNKIANGNITAIKLAPGAVDLGSNAIVGTLTATHIDSDVFNVTKLHNGRTLENGDENYSSWFGLSRHDNINDYDFFLVIIGSSGASVGVSCLADQTEFIFSVDTARAIGARLRKNNVDGNGRGDLDISFREHEEFGQDDLGTTSVGGVWGIKG